MAKGTFPLTALLLKGRGALLCLFSMKNSELLGPNGNSLMAKVTVTAWGGRKRMNKFCVICDQKPLDPFSRRFQEHHITRGIWGNDEL